MEKSCRLGQLADTYNDLSKKLLIFLLVLWQNGQSQTLHYSLAAPWLGQGACSKQFKDVFSFTANQAALARTGNMAAGLYGERRFLLQELSLYRFALSFPLAQDGMGLTLSRFGYAGFNESSAGVAYGKQLGKVDLGIQLNYYMRQAAGYEGDGTVYAEIGTIWHTSDKLHIGFHLLNPQGGRFRKNRKEKLASIYTTSVGYEVSENVLIHTSFIKEEDRSVYMYAGFQYRFANQFFASGGMTTSINAPYFSAGWRKQQLRIDVTAAYHFQLGITPGLLIIYSQNNPEK